jgi:cytochrome c553
VKVIGLKLILSTASLAIAFSAAGHAGDDDDDGVPTRGLKGKLEYCKDCHGASGRGYVGFVPIPRLAGQTPEYIENQLRLFVERQREKQSFLNMAKVHGVSSSMRATLAAHFKALNPGPFGDGPKNLVSRGKTIYE